MIDRIHTMFNHNYTPASAYKELIKLLKKECNTEIEFHEKLSHRSKMPLQRDFNQLYTQYKIDKYGSKDLRSMFSLLHAKINNLIQKDDNYLIQFQDFNCEKNTPFISAVITPLMKRVHTMVRLN